MPQIKYFLRPSNIFEFEHGIAGHPNNTLRRTVNTHPPLILKVLSTLINVVQLYYEICLDVRKAKIQANVHLKCLGTKAEFKALSVKRMLVLL